MNLKQIEGWFKSQPIWVNEAVRRLLQDSNLSEDDYKELADLSKREITDKASISKPEISFQSLTSSDEEGELNLVSISDIEGVNSLHPRHPLLFGGKPITLVYGGNGSGKSGYVRLLKHLCGSPNIERLLPNVFSKAKEVQRCKIEYKLGDKLQTVSLENGIKCVDDLCKTDVFDGNTGLQYYNERTCKYEPPLLVLFSQLNDVFDRVKSILEAEHRQLNTNLPFIGSDISETPAGKWYKKINKSTKKAEIDKWCSWTKKDDQALKKLLVEVDGSNIEERRASTSSHLDFTSSLLGQLQKLCEQLSDKNITKILRAKADLETKKELADLAASELFKDEPLLGIGTHIWQELWECARAFSQGIAYDKQTFPYTEGSARCVLCLQELTDAGKRRLVSFENFIKGKTQSDYMEAASVYEELNEDIIVVPSEEEVAKTLKAAGISKEDVVGNITTIYECLRKRQAILNQGEELPPECVLSVDGVIKQLKNRKAKLQIELDGYDSKKGNDQKESNDTKINELKAQEWVSRQKKAIIEAIAILKQKNNLQLALNTASTTALSKKKGELSQSMVTDEYVARFKDELARLSGNHLKVAIVKTRVSKGAVLHELKLEGADGTPVTNVLSEGENKVVTLAAFLADVGSKNFRSPFIFDDPINSLDEDYEMAVAQRLVELSNQRQVIIYTHRLTFFGCIHDIAKKNDMEYDAIGLTREVWGSGEPGGPPFIMTHPKKHLNRMLTEDIPRAREALTTEGSASANPLTQAVCSGLRKSLEGVIEHVLLADVIKRYRRELKTKGKLNKLADINSADCCFLDDLMSKYSFGEHLQPTESPVKLPDLDEITKDINAVIKWIGEFQSR